MESRRQKWFEVSYQKVVYGPIHNETKKFYDLKEAYEYADEIKDKYPRSRVWINKCILEKEEIA